MPPLLMVDDKLTISKCDSTASVINATVNTFIKCKKLKLSHKKCCVIHVGKKTGSCPTLKVHEQIMHSSGKSKYNLLDRTTKAHTILSEIRAILTDVPLGKYRTEIGLQLGQAMFVNGLLFNSEAWQGNGSSDIKCLENVDHQLMRVICNGYAKTPLEFMYMETAVTSLSQNNLSP